MKKNLYKTRKMISLTLDKELLKEFDEVCKKQSLKRSIVFDNCMQSFIEDKDNNRQNESEWCRMYMEELGEAMMKIANRPNATILFLKLWNYYRKDGTIRMPKYDELGSEIGMDKYAISKAIKVLKENKLIAKIDNKWRYNPFIVGTTNQSDTELGNAQYIWEMKINKEN